jgi:hypothetical protein
MDYCLDAGDGSVSMWTGPAALDLDGDGLLDDLMADEDGDGRADHAVLDLDDDSVPEARYTDDGTGTWALSGTPERALRWLSLDGVEHTGPGDVDGDGTADELLDVDRDGLADRAVSNDGATGYVDTDRDGRWDLRLLDFDGDGAADGAGPPH